jgi:hypothetical protein
MDEPQWIQGRLRIVVGLHMTNRVRDILANAVNLLGEQSLALRIVRRLTKDRELGPRRSFAAIRNHELPNEMVK